VRSSRRTLMTMLSPQQPYSALHNLLLYRVL
jgi:hypothetical protein